LKMREDGSFTHEGRKERREKNATTISLIQFPVFMHTLLLSFSSVFESNPQKTGRKILPNHRGPNFLFRFLRFDEKRVF